MVLNISTYVSGTVILFVSDFKVKNRLALMTLPHCGEDSTISHFAVLRTRELCGTINGVASPAISNPQASMFFANMWEGRKRENVW